MKTKLKNAGAAKTFFLSHGEKLLIAVIGLVAGWIVYSSFSADKESREPRELNQLASSVSSSIEQFTWERAVELAQEQDPEAVRLASSFSPKLANQIDPEAYTNEKLAIGANSIVPPIVLRSDPKLLPPVGLEGHGGTVSMAFYDEAIIRERELEAARNEAQTARDREEERLREAEDENRRGGRNGNTLEDDLGKGIRPVEASIPRAGVDLDGDELVRVVSYAAVLAKVPTQEQLKIYENTFRDALGYNESRDMPSYIGYVVERAEVQRGEELKWELVKVRNGRGGSPAPGVTIDTLNLAIADWPSELEEIVDPDYLNSLFSFPLPPLVGKEWGAEVIHSDVPLAIETEAEQERLAREAEKLEEGPAEKKGGIFSGPRRPVNGANRDREGFSRPGSRRGGPSGRRGGPPGGFGDGPSGGFGGELGGPPGGFSGRGGGGGGFSRSSRSGDEAINFEVPFVMLRFFDFSVEPGRKYRYRIQLVVNDVNGHGLVSKDYLDKEVRARIAEVDPQRIQLRRTDWSEPSSIIAVPMQGEVSIASVKLPPANAFNGEPTARLLVQSFDTDETGKAIQGAIKRDFFRGSVINLIEETEILIEQNRYLKKVEDFKFQTGATLLDMQGGEKITRDMNAPAKILVMDAAGQLSVKDELEDYKDVDQHRMIYEEKSDARSRGGGFGSPFGDGPRGGF